MFNSANLLSPIEIANLSITPKTGNAIRENKYGNFASKKDSVTQNSTQNNTVSGKRSFKPASTRSPKADYATEVKVPRTTKRTSNSIFNLSNIESERKVSQVTPAADTIFEGTSKIVQKQVMSPVPEFEVTSEFMFNPISISIDNAPAAAAKM